MPQTSLAGLVGISFQQLQKYEKGDDRVSPAWLIRIADALGVTVSYFFGERASGAEPTPAEEIIAMLNDAAAVRLLQAFAKIEGAATKANVITLVERLSR